MIIPSGINDIQPRATQVWNWDEFGFDTNVIWNKIICTYNLFQVERMWKVQTGYWAPFYCTLIVFTLSGGKCFMSPIIVHQDTDYTQYLHFNVRMEWKFHHTTYGYMDRYGWLKSMTKFSNICGAPPCQQSITVLWCKLQPHFDDGTLRKMMEKKSNPLY